MKKLLIGIVIVIVVVIGGWLVFGRSPGEQGAMVSPTPTPSALPEASAVATFVITDVAAHAGVESCWVAVSGSVYDVTAWIPKHPGGPDKILRLCGTDGTDAFTGKHGEQEKPNETLATFKIGDLTQ